jgi:hypothetical protein
MGMSEIGAPLARAEVRMMLEQPLVQTSRIVLSERDHGPPASMRSTMSRATSSAGCSRSM